MTPINDTFPKPDELLLRIKKTLIASALGRYLGLGLPKRDSKFSLVARFTTAKFSMETNSDALLEKWEQLRDKPNILLEELINHLEQLNKNNKLSSDEFYAHLIFAIHYAFPLLEEYYYRFRKNGGIPDSNLKTLLVEGAIRLLQLMVRGAAIQFQTDYLLPNHKLVKVLDRLGSVLLLLLELVWLLQNLHMIRYKKLPNDLKILVGKALVAYLPFGDTTIKRQLLSRANLSLLLETDTVKGTSRATASLQELFILIAFVGLLDTNAWRTEHLTMSVAVLATLDPPLAIHPCEAESEVADGQWVFSIPLGEFVAPGKTFPLPAFLFDRLPLQESLTKYLPASLSLLSGGVGAPIFSQPPFSTLNTLDLWSTLSLLHENLFCSYTPPMLSDRVEHKANLHVILGYLSCFNLIYDFKSLPLAQFIEKNSMILSLSQGSSILVGNQDEDVKAKGKGKEKTKEATPADEPAEERRNIWQINLDMGNEKYLYLNTTESDRSRPMRVGQVLLFLYKSDQGWQHGEMGFIRRIVRGVENKIYIGIHRFSEQYLSVLLKRVGQGEATLRAMSVQDADGSEYLLAPPHPLFSQGTTVEAMAPGLPPRQGILGQPAFPGLECVAFHVVWQKVVHVSEK